MDLEIPFRLRGRDGKVVIEYGVNDDPERWGCHLLGLPYDYGVARGFPVVRASVEYEGEGYGAVTAWIQTVRYRIADGDEQVEVDKPPQLKDSRAILLLGAEPLVLRRPINGIRRCHVDSRCLPHNVSRHRDEQSDPPDMRLPVGL